MHQSYKNSMIRQLRDQQVRFAPRDKKLEQLKRAEQLLQEVDPVKNYPYDLVCFRVTAFRPDSSTSVVILGEDLRHDLRLLVEDLSESARLTRDNVDEGVLMVEDLSRMYHVSTKTVSRWRQQGLVSRLFECDGRKRVGFLKSSVDRFVADNEARVKRGERFSLLTEGERQDIVRQLRVLAQTGGRPTEITRQVANQTGRSQETIRNVLRQFDEQYPELAIFPERSGPLSIELRSKILQDFRRGVSLEALAKEHSRSKATIYRIVNLARCEALRDLSLDFIDSPEFHAEKLPEEAMLAPMPESPHEVHRKPRLPSGLPPYLASLYEIPLLSREQEQHLFRKMNYLKFKAGQLRAQLDANHPKASLMDEIDHLHDEAVATKNQIIRANLRLVVSIAKRHVGPRGNFFELVSDGNMSLIRAVEKFDYTRGNKFSTYATWAIMKNFARTIPDEQKHQDRFRTSAEEMFGAATDARTDAYALEHAQIRRESQIERMLKSLDEREQQIIISRFGLDHDVEPRTLKEVGESIGVTKERVRQIEARALSKLRKAAEEQEIDFFTVDKE